MTGPVSSGGRGKRFFMEFSSWLSGYPDDSLAAGGSASTARNAMAGAVSLRRFGTTLGRDTSVSFLFGLPIRPESSSPLPSSDIGHRRAHPLSRSRFLGLRPDGSADAIEGEMPPELGRDAARASFSGGITAYVKDRRPNAGSAVFGLRLFCGDDAHLRPALAVLSPNRRASFLPCPWGPGAC